jgi:hypothetical protein
MWPQAETNLCGFSLRENYADTRNRHLSAKLVSTFADRRCRVVSAKDPHGCILIFLHWSQYYFFQVAAQLYSHGWEDPIPDSLLLRKYGSAWNRTRGLWICSQKLWPLNQRWCGPIHTLKSSKSEKSLYTELVHITCLAHALHRVTDKTRSKFLQVDVLVSCHHTGHLKNWTVSSISHEMGETQAAPSPEIQ